MIFRKLFLCTFTIKWTTMKNRNTILTFILISLSLIIIPGCQTHTETKQKPMITIKKEPFGRVDGKQVDLYTIVSGQMTVKITNYGAIVTSILFPDRIGHIEDVVLGFDSLAGYMGENPYFGCIVGRYANRIAKARFELDGKEYSLYANNGENHLHGGLEGFNKKVWDAQEFRSGEEAGIDLTYTSPDGEEGYPGELKVLVRYTLSPHNELKIRYRAESTKPTPVNLTQHSYFNLKGAGEGDILDHELQIDAEQYLVVDENLIPTGELKAVPGTAFDFLVPKTIGQDIAAVKGGYDHNFILYNEGQYCLVAKLTEPICGREMEVYTDQPGLQFYSGNFLDGSLTGKNGKVYKKYYGLCLETQHFPDSPNHTEFPNTILDPGKVLETITVYKFLID